MGKRCKEKRICAIDSTGFSIRRFVRWFDIRRSRKKRKDFLKLNFTVDVSSLLLILTFKVTPPFKSDSKQVEYLLSFIRNDLRRLCADKAYFSRKICNLVARYGVMPTSPSRRTSPA